MPLIRIGWLGFAALARVTPSATNVRARHGTERSASGTTTGRASGRNRRSDVPWAHTRSVKPRAAKPKVMTVRP
jgi:hypothetical protein